MVEDNVVEEIYAVLVEQFGVDNLFLPKRGKKRPRTITWKDFIKATLEEEELYKYCGYANTGSFSSGIKRAHPSIVKEKGSRPWFHFLLYLAGYKRCPECNNVLMVTNFSYTSTHKDGLHTECKECARECAREYYKKNKGSILEKAREYQQANKEQYMEQHKKYYLNNKHIFAAYNAKRRATKLQASPLWADQEKIKQIYATRPEGYHVDHIIPLQHPLVCGLHCEFNLQHLPAAENLTKHNRFDLD